MKKTLLAIALSLALVLMLAACGSAPAAETEAPAAVPQVEASENVEVEENTGRQDGERFEEVIMLEGMEETVGYEHVRNETAGFELDYEYEDLERRTQADGECFVSRWDDPQDPWNYLEVKYDQGNAELVASAVQATLSGAYNTVDEEPCTLEGVGSCVCIEASGAKDGSVPAGSLQTVYIIPSGGGCLVATAHCTIESAEGFGARFSYMMNTLTLIEG